MNSDSCKHNIAANKACPWCKRETRKGFEATKPFQLYQTHFGKFNEAMFLENAQGPLGIVVLALDMNGQPYMYRQGPTDLQLKLVNDFIRQVSPATGRKEAESCFVNKLKNGFGKLFS